MSLTVRHSNESSPKAGCLCYIVYIIYNIMYISVKMAAPWGSLALLIKLLFALSSLAQPLKRVRSIPEHFFVILN